MSGPDFYYSDRFQVIEDRIAGEEVFLGSQYVWSERYIDAMVLRDRDANEYAEDGREERLYVQQDASFNTTALLADSGTKDGWQVVERTVYDPYGGRTFKAEDWSSAGSFSSYNWVYLFQGGRQEPVTGLIYLRGRDYSTTLGRFIQPDPIGYADGANRYQMEGSNPVNRLDPMGLKMRDTPFKQTPGYDSDEAKKARDDAARKANKDADYNPRPPADDPSHDPGVGGLDPDNIYDKDLALHLRGHGSFAAEARKQAQENATHTRDGLLGALAGQMIGGKQRGRGSFWTSERGNEPPSPFPAARTIGIRSCPGVARYFALPA
jgi:RHS repeat-associated protein